MHENTIRFHLNRLQTLGRFDLEVACVHIWLIGAVFEVKLHLIRRHSGSITRVIDLTQIALPLIRRVRHRHVVAISVLDPFQAPLEDSNGGILDLEGRRAAKEILRAYLVGDFPPSSRQFLDPFEAPFDFGTIEIEVDAILHQIGGDTI